MNSDPVLETNGLEDRAPLRLSVANDKGNAQAPAAMPLFSPEMSPSLSINQERCELGPEATLFFHAGLRLTIPQPTSDLGASKEESPYHRCH